MPVATKPAHGSPRCRFAVEPLEDRSLLSGLTVPSQPDAEAESLSADVAAADQLADQPGDHVQVVEISPEEADAEGDTARVIAVEELPEPVVSAVADRFPGATLVAAEVDSEDGSLLFDVSLSLDGVDMEVTLSADGEVLEIEQAIALADLPQAVRDWIATNFPGASVSEADLVTVGDTVSYELLIATPSEQAFEATLRLVADSGLDAFQPSEALGESVTLLPTSFDLFETGSFDQAAAEDSAAVLETAASPSGDETEPSRRTALVTAAAVAGTEPAHHDAAAVVADSGHQPQDAAAGADSQGAGPADSDGANRVANNQPVSLAATIQPIVSTIATIPVVWLPQIAQAIAEVFPLDVTPIEESLRGFLDEVDSLAQKITLAHEASRLTPPLLVAVAALLGAERLMTEMRRAKRDPVLTARAGKSTWTWVLNLSWTQE